MNEADTCRTYVTPKLQAAGWDQPPYHLTEQCYFTNPKGRIRIVAGRVVRGEPKRADYLLGYRRDFPLAVVEAKADHKRPGAGLSQAKLYAEILGLKFAYATNGIGIVEFDFLTGRETAIDAFPTPEALWARLTQQEPLPEAHKQTLLTPFYRDPERIPRYYQTIAVNRTVDAIMRGQQRILITMATGTGKTLVAFQICYFRSFRPHRNHLVLGTRQEINPQTPYII